MVHVQRTEERTKGYKSTRGTVEKMTDNHYSVGLLWKEHRPVLPFNRDLAIMRLNSLGNQFKKDPEFHKTYKNTMKDYINKGHASKLSLEELHLTQNVNKPGKVRVVFDAGAKSTSLNENLFKGPDLLLSLIGVLIRFRKE